MLLCCSMFSTHLITRKLVVFLNGALILSFLILAPLMMRAQRPLGTDISDYQGIVNWPSLTNAGVVCAWTKATEGTYFTATSFVANVESATNYGIPIGAYHFARSHDDPNITGSDSADSEAAYFWGVAGSYVKAGGGYLVPMLDWEDPVCSNANGFTITFMSQWVNEWCNDISNDAAAQGVILRPVVYSGTWYTVPSSGGTGYPGLNSTVTSWPDWFAAYPASAFAQTGNPGGNSPWPSWYIWQYGDTNWSGGDADVYIGNYQNFLQMFEIGGTNAPYFQTVPTNIVVNLGTNVTLYSTVSGQAPFNFQWFFNGKIIPGATSSNYTIVGVQLTNAGDYTVIGSNPYGKVPYQAILSVLGPLTNSPGSALDPANLVNWWTGNGNGYDIYGVTNTAPFGNLSYTNAEVGTGFRFDGSSAFLSNNAAEIAPPWTLSVWVYRQNAPGAAASILGDQTYAIKLEQYNTTRQVGMSKSGVGDYLFQPGYTVPQNRWTHLAFVATSSSVSLYANGVLEGSTNVSNFELPRFYIGTDLFVNLAGDYDDFLLGGLDELQIFNRALATSEIQSIYNAGSAGLVRAPQFTSVTNLNNGLVQLNLIGQTGKAITLLSSPDLLNWSTLGLVADPGGATNYTDSTTASPQKFYQATQKY
jgi:GH25 family lysozyme M1 (1,4-beta-N-acetylmuramidase)